MSNNYYTEFNISQQRVSDAQRERSRDRLANEAALHRMKYGRPGRIIRLLSFTRHQITRLTLLNRPTASESTENLPSRSQSEFVVKFSD